MGKQSSTFHCTNCDYRPPKWVGCCPECEEWGSIAQMNSPSTKTTAQAALLTRLPDISIQDDVRFTTKIAEWDRVMGGGIVPGSLLIITGDPGIGKSTLLLQVAYALAHQHKVLYFSSEESLGQVKRRALRLSSAHENMLFSDEVHLEQIAQTIINEKPDLVVIDSIQNCYAQEGKTIPGSVGQLREAAFTCMRIAKEHNVAIIVTGHITKDGTIAGPKMLEHMVDGVFYLQGEDQWHTRVLRSVKNRFGPIYELGFFEMHEDGLKEVPNINEQLLASLAHTPGSALISTMEGTRPLLVEMQALTVQSRFASPQRVVSGIDHKQVVLIAAILEKYLHIKLSEQDIFFKISGGFKIKDSGCDLGIALALLSSYFQKPLPESAIALGEMSLTGQIKPINRVNMHLHEAEKFGLKHVLVATAQQLEKTAVKQIAFKNVYDLLSLFSE